MARAISLAVLGLVSFSFGCGSGQQVPPDHNEPIDAWVKKLNDPKESLAVKTEAIQVLGMKGAGSPEAVNAVSGALSEKGTLTRMVAVNALRKMNSKAAIPALKNTAAKDADPGVREAAAAAVIQLEALP